MTKSDKGGRAVHPKPAAQPGPGSKRGPRRQDELPGWTNGLKQLYDQVVDEDLPDSLRDILAQFDKSS